MMRPFWSWVRFSKKKRDWSSTLREFIYLDEVSVTSLLAARDGEIPSSVTNTLARSAQTESKFSATLPSKGASIGGEVRNSLTDSSSTEVVRRAVIQSTFRRLHIGGDRKNRPFGDGRSLPSKYRGAIGTVAELEKRYEKLEKAGLARRLNSMSRGDLIELEVTLRPAKTFIAGHAIQSLARVMSGRPELFGDAAYQVHQATPIADVLNDLMVGLVPIHGVGTHMALLQSGDQVYLVDRRALSPGSEAFTMTTSLEIVAQTDEASYWKDLRRILYSGNRYTIYARLASIAPKYDWTALKLNELLKDLSADLGAAVTGLEVVVEEQLDSLSTTQEAAIDGRSMMENFSRLLPGDVPSDKQPSIDESIAKAAGHFQTAESTVDIRSAFDLIIDAHEAATGLPVDRVNMAKIRADVFKVADAEQVAKSLHGKASSKRRVGLLEVEVIAIYW